MWDAKNFVCGKGGRAKICYLGKISSKNCGQNLKSQIAAFS